MRRAIEQYLTAETYLATDHNLPASNEAVDRCMAMIRMASLWPQPEIVQEQLAPEDEK